MVGLDFIDRFIPALVSKVASQVVVKIGPFVTAHEVKNMIYITKNTSVPILTVFACYTYNCGKVASRLPSGPHGSKSFGAQSSRKEHITAVAFSAHVISFSRST